MDFVSITLADPHPSRPFDEYQRAVDVLRTKGCIVVAGAGNSGTSVLAPANSLGVIAVGKVKEDGVIFPDSCYGAIERFNIISNDVTVVARGDNIRTFNLDGSEGQLGATSASCAQVAGLAALMKRRFQLKFGKYATGDSDKLVDTITGIMKNTSCGPRELYANPEGYGNPYGAGHINCNKATQLIGS
jgi:hypothetical protein